MWKVYSELARLEGDRDTAFIALGSGIQAGRDHPVPHPDMAGPSY